MCEYIQGIYMQGTCECDCACMCVVLLRVFVCSGNLRERDKVEAWISCRFPRTQLSEISGDGWSLPQLLSMIQTKGFGLGLR